VPIRLKGSCRCGAVRFSVDSHTPYPYQRCYCSICRKSAGAGGYAINIMGVAASLEVAGRRAVRVLLHPFASAIDTELPKPPANVHLLLRDKAAWVEPQIGPGDECYEGYPALSIEEWHRRRGLWIE